MKKLITTFLFRFDPRTNACINGPAMNTPRAWHCLFSDGTRLLAIGGNNAYALKFCSKYLLKSKADKRHIFYHIVSLSLSLAATTQFEARAYT